MTIKLPSAPVMDIDDRAALLRWLFDHLDEEPDIQDPFYIAEQINLAQHRNTARGIDYEAANDRIHSFITSSIWQCLYAFDLPDEDSISPDTFYHLAYLLSYLDRDLLSPDDKQRLQGFLARLIVRAPMPFDAAALLAQADNDNYRAQVAAALRPDTEAKRKLLHTLLKDPSPRVRVHAAESLAASGTTAWWQGFFATDPTPSFDDDAHEAAARAWMRACEQASPRKPLPQAVIASTLERLPPAAQGSALRLFLRDPLIAQAHSASLGPLLAQTPDAHLILDSLPAHWISNVFVKPREILQKFSEYLTPQSQRALWELLFAALPTSSSASSADEDPYAVKCDLLMAYWPPEVPYTAFFARLDAGRKRDRAAYDRTADALWAAFTAHAEAKQHQLPWPQITKRFCEDVDCHSIWTPIPDARAQAPRRRAPSSAR